VSTVSTQEEVSPAKHTLQVVVVSAAVGVDLVALILAFVGVAPGFLPLFTFPATLFLVGWGVTWLARRQAGRLLAEGAAAPPLLAGRRLWAIRAGCLMLFAAAALVYAFALAVVWREANVFYAPQPYDEIVATGSFGLTWQEQYTLSAAYETPGWYPWLVVVREALVFVAALAIAWSVFASRPRHWMAYFVAGLVALGPLGDLDAVRSSQTAVGGLAELLTWVLFLGAGGFLWMFPDGHFGRTYLRYLGVVCIALAVGYLFVWNIGAVLWPVFWPTAILLVTGGVATQVWRYRHVPLSSKRLARWNLAILAAIPAWGLFYPWVYGRFERGVGVTAFAWHQVHLTIYLAGPVLLGLWVLYLMRNQGWWDAQRFWHRTTVLAILAPLFVAAYVGILVAVTVVTRAISGDKSQTVAVLIATAAVAFAFRPVQRVVTGWVDRRFFPSRRIADETVARFTDRVRQEADAATVRDELLAVVHETLGPEHAAVWVAGQEAR
jgi:hypothetical protein